MNTPNQFVRQKVCELFFVSGNSITGKTKTPRRMQFKGDFKIHFDILFSFLKLIPFEVQAQTCITRSVDLNKKPIN